jgi:hypothetical protein
MAGIDVMSQYISTGRLKILRPACLPLIRELGLYRYDPEGISEEPLKEDDHSIDAFRYLITCISCGRRVEPIPFAAPSEATRHSGNRLHDPSIWR